MDQLSPTSGLNWYTSYNAFGELLGGGQLPPAAELAGVDGGGRESTPQVQVQFAPPLPQLSGGTVHYVHDPVSLQAHIVQDTLPVHTAAALPPPTDSSTHNHRIRPALGEKIACQECGATFACGANLRNHMRIHTGERPYVCEECGASFTQRSNLRSHKRVHTGERPYMCGICGQTFARSSHLPGHMRTHTGEKPFNCSHCGRSFATNQIMKNHMRTHTGERPFVCDICDATFAQSSCLATHKKIHTGERNFKCVLCGKAFISRSGLQTHERVHTGEKPYACEKCDKSFKTSSYLSKHKQKYCGNNGYKNRIQRTDTKKSGRKPTSRRKMSKSRKTVNPPGKPPKRVRAEKLRRSLRHRNSDPETHVVLASSSTEPQSENNSYMMENLVKNEEVVSIGSCVELSKSGSVADAQMHKVDEKMGHLFTPGHETNKDKNYEPQKENSQHMSLFHRSSSHQGLPQSLSQVLGHDHHCEVTGVRLQLCEAALSPGLGEGGLCGSSEVVNTPLVQVDDVEMRGVLPRPQGSDTVLSSRVINTPVSPGAASTHLPPTSASVGWFSRSYL